MDGLGGWLIDVNGGDGNDTLAGAKLATDLSRAMRVRGAPVVRVGKRGVLAGRSKQVAIRLTCPAGEPGDCLVTVDLRRNGRVLGRRRIRLAGGEQGVAEVRLSKSLRTLLKKRGKLGVRASVKAVDDAGNARTRVVKLTLVKR